MNCKIINFEDARKKFRKKPSDPQLDDGNDNSGIVVFDRISIPSGMYKLPRAVGISKSTKNILIYLLMDAVEYYGWEYIPNAHRPRSPDENNCVFEITTLNGYKVPDDFRHTIATCTHINEQFAIQIFEAMAKYYNWPEVGE